MKNPLAVGKGLVLLAGLLGTLSAAAGTVVWSGGAGDADWSNGANWSGGSAPAATDTASFATTVSVTPPSSFTGVLAVSSGTLTVNVGDALACSAAVDAGATLVKTGAGTLTLRPEPGVHTGAVTVNAGEIAFQGNGLYAAPGMFGKLTVAAGARASVAESPAATRHGALARVCANDAAVTVTQFTNLYSTAAGFVGAWNDIAITNANQQEVFVADDATESHWLDGMTWMPSAWRSSDNFTALTRVLVVSPTAGRVSVLMRGDDFAYTYLNGVPLFFVNNNTIQRTAQMAAGWNALDAVFIENAGLQYLYVQLTGLMYDAENYLTASHLWKGVCFTDLDLAAGGTLAVGADQAVAFAFGATPRLNGSVTGGAGAHFSVMSGELAFDAARFADFAGVVEVGAFGSLVAQKMTDGMDVSFSVAGTVDVPAGTVVTNVFGAVRFTGTGTLVSSSLAGTEDFEGTVVVTGAVASAGELARGTSSATWRLSDGAHLSVSNDALAEVLSPVDGFAVPQAWTFNGKSNVSNEVLTCNIAYVTNGNVLVITDDGGQQRNSSILTNRMFSAYDVFEASFDYDARLVKRFSNETLAEGMSAFFTRQPCGYGQTGEGFPTDAYGFYVYLYRAGVPGFGWIANGQISGSVDISETTLGINFSKPVAFRVRLEYGVLTVTMRQGTKCVTLARNVSAAFASAVKRYFGFSGGTGWWGAPPANSDVYALQTISNFVGRASGGPREWTDGYVPFGSNTWTLAGAGIVVTNGDELLTGWEYVSGGRKGQAVCKKPIPVRQPFVFEFSECCDNSTQGWAEGGSIFVKPTGSAITLNSNYCPSMAQCVAFGHYYWENRFGWVHNGSGISADWTGEDPGGIPKEHGINVIRFSHDGAGRFTALVRRGTAVYTATRFYPDVLTWGDTLELAIATATSGWGARLQVRFADPIFRLTSEPTFTPAGGLVVADGASATLTLGTYTANGVTNAVAFPSAALGAGSTLTLVGGNGTGTRLAVPALTTEGAASIVAGNEIVVELDEVTEEGPLTVTGCWSAPSGTLTFRVDEAKVGSGLLLAELDATLCRSAGEPVFQAVSRTGTDLTRKYRLVYQDGSVRLLPRGCCIFIR